MAMAGSAAEAIAAGGSTEATSTPATSIAAAASADAGPYRTVAYDSKNWGEQVYQALHEDGVVVVSGVLTDDECPAHMAAIVDHFKKLCPAVSEDPKTWKAENLPSGPRAGLFQSLVAQFPTVWKLRTDKRVREVFTQAYSGLRGYPVEDFTVSCDGINVRPNIGPFHTPSTDDWAHLDQTIRDRPFECVQGQVVLSNSTACFRCSPRSHHLHSELLDLASCHSKGNWCKFAKGLYPRLSSLVEEAGGQWQVPVQVPRGSMILWLSSTVHSARLQLPKSPVDKSDPWSQWRGVVYICYRPKAEVDQKHLQRIRQAFHENRCTNHWGEKTFPKRPGGRFSSQKGGKHPALEALLDNPEHAYRKPSLRPQETEAVRAFYEW
eukprot:m.309226 g.309226  ORF g.309226 m.309226 type:complete len:379 (+) comp19637_c0_seq5:3303-4439(+)